MNILVPNYYHRFKCIADKCRHSCCIGWEIDIDEDTADYYNSIEGQFGQLLRQNISPGNPPHFILKEGDRCPFLNKDGLCDIICELGEDALCGICADHPRFRNFYSDFTEVGLGICCEEAGRVILGEKDSFSLVPLEYDDGVSLDEEEECILQERDKVIALLTNREMSVLERFTYLAEIYGIDFSGFSLGELCEKYLSLERLDEAWTVTLESLKNHSFDLGIFKEKEFQIPFEQLAVYFIFRHFTNALWDGNIESKVRFALESCFIIGALCRQNDADFEQLIEYARMYSAEVEYSEENLNRLFG